MKTSKTIILLALAAVVSTVSCSAKKDLSDTEQGETSYYELSGFDKIRVSGIVHVYVTQGQGHGIKVVESTAHDIKTIVEKRGNTLNIYTKSPKNSFWKGKRGTNPVVYVEMASLSRVDGSGATHITMGDFVTADLSLNISGASMLELGSTAAKAVDIACHGASKITAKAMSCESLRTGLTGASQMKADFRAKGDAKMQCSGASTQKITLGSRTLDITNSGASTSRLRFKGGRVSARNSGAGNMQLEVDCEFLKASNSGASKFSITGTADRTDIDLSGVSKIDTSGLNRY